MSNFAGHRNAGVVASLGIFGASIAYGMSHENAGIAAGCTLAFSLFPDIDIKSTPSKIFYWCVAIVLGYCYYAKEHAIGNLIGLISILPQLTRHRGILHHPLTAFVLPFGIFYLYYLKIITLEFASHLYLGSVVGYLTHLFMDRKRKVPK